MVDAPVGAVEAVAPHAQRSVRLRYALARVGPSARDLAERMGCDESAPTDAVRATRVLSMRVGLASRFGLGAVSGADQNLRPALLMIRATSASSSLICAAICAGPVW